MNDEHRKSKDRISQSQFVTKTGLCKRIITKALQSLSTMGLIIITDRNGNILQTTLERKGVSRIFYSRKPAHFITPSSAKGVPIPEHKSAMNKTNHIKVNKTKLRELGHGVVSAGEIIAKMTS